MKFLDDWRGVLDWMQFGVLIIFALVMLVVYREFIGPLYRYWVKHLFQLLILSLLFGIVYAHVGQTLGIPELFWNESTIMRLSAAIGATLVLGILGVSAFFLTPERMLDHMNETTTTFLKSWEEYTSWMPRWPSLDREKAKNAWELNRFLRMVRLPFLTLLALPAFLPGSCSSLPRFAPTLSMRVVALHENPAFFPGLEWISQNYVVKNPDVDTNPVAYAINAFVWSAGIGIGFLILKLGVWISPWIDRRMTWPIARRLYAKQVAEENASAADGGRSRRIHGGHLGLSAEKRGSIVTFFLILSVFYLIFNLPGVYDQITAPFAICALLGLVTSASVFLSLFPPRIRLPILLGTVVWIGVANHDVDKLRFEHLSYEKPRKLDPSKFELYYSGKDPATGEPMENQTIDYEGNPFAGKSILASNDGALEGWKTFVGGNPREKPKLAVVSVTGGASRSAYWSVVVLDRLAEQIPGFQDHIRIITGASGGMVGSAHYVKWLSDFRAKNDVYGKKFSIVGKTIPYNSLRRVARYIALRDPWKMFLPFTTWSEGDRGRELEGDWEEIREVPLKSFREWERQGKLPSLIFSPMTIEDGRRLLISNLDLRRLAFDAPSNNQFRRPPAYPSLGMKELAPRALAFSVSGGVNDVDPSGKELQPLSFTGIEFYKVFSGEAGEDFRLSTAARMSATFPFVSPAVYLPSEPNLRVVDAGYYDNYGVDVATEWLFHNREWVAENCSGVVLVQIRDSISRDDRLGYRKANSWDELWNIWRGFEFFSSVRDGFLKARESTSMFRDDDDVAALGSELARMTGDRAFFTTVIFENSANVEIQNRSRNEAKSEWPNPEVWPSSASCKPFFDKSKPTPATRDVAMSWYLTASERHAMEEGIPDPAEVAPGRWPSLDALMHDPEARRSDVHRLGELAKSATEPKLRAYLFRQFERARNYERMYYLAEWWKR